jgi:hypothetical protein
VICVIHGCPNEAAKNSNLCGQCLSRIDPRYEAAAFEESARSGEKSEFTRPRPRG